MSRTAEGAALTARHREGQLRIRAGALRDYLTLWPLWDGDSETFTRLIAATLPLVRTHHRLSASLAAAYYEAFRQVERVPGTPTPRLAPPIEPEKVAASLLATGREQTAKSLVGGRTPQEAMRAALTRTSGAVGRHVLDGGRSTVIGSMVADRAAIGYARATGANSCAFCAMLASRGPVYVKDSVDFTAHDHCTCGIEVVYEGADWPAHSRDWQRLWNQHAAGAGQGEQLKAFRRALSAPQ